MYFSEKEGEKRSTFAKTPRTLQVLKIIADALGKSEIETGLLYNYGCWCGKRGHGKYVDNFDL